MFGIKRMTKQEIRVAKKMGPFITVWTMIVIALTYAVMKVLGGC
jgi:hypothetical protein